LKTKYIYRKNSLLLFFVCFTILQCYLKKKNIYTGLQNSLKQNIQHILSSDLYNNVSIGIYISTTDGKSILYTQNASRLYITASAFKIISSAGALMKFGPDFKFQTPLLTDGLIEQGSLKGNLYIKGSGDPSLNLSDLEKAVRNLKRQGIKKIKGDLIYDVSFLDQEKNRYSPNARNLYAPPCALTVNYSWIQVIIKDGPPPILTLQPETSYVQLKYDVNISHTFNPGRPVMTYKTYPWGDLYTIKGTISLWDKKYHYVWLGVSRPGLYAATLLKETMEKNGIKISGRIRKNNVPLKTRKLYTIKSTPLKNIIKIMNQESNNIIAETLNKDLGAAFLSIPGTRQKGIKVLEKFCIKEIGMKKGEFSIGDASGLSIKNRFTPEQLVQALNYFYKKKKIKKAFLESLARQGHHPHAMNPVPPDDIKIYVKTGTLSVTGVNTVVGYIIMEETGDSFSFAILANREKPGPMTYSGTLTNPILIGIVNSLKKNMGINNKTNCSKF